MVKFEKTRGLRRKGNGNKKVKFANRPKKSNA